MSTSEDIQNGIVCSGCCAYLLDENDNLNTAGFPCMCEDCWKELPKKQKKNWSYFSDKGEVVPPT